MTSNIFIALIFAMGSAIPTRTLAGGQKILDGPPNPSPSTASITRRGESYPTGQWFRPEPSVPKTVVVPSKAATPVALPQPRLGITVRELSSMERARTKVSQGLLVEAVSGPAAQAGILIGDIVTSVNGEPVHNFGELSKLVTKAEKSIALMVQRGEKQIFVPVQLKSLT